MIHDSIFSPWSSPIKSFSPIKTEYQLQKSSPRVTPTKGARIKTDRFISNRALDNEMDLAQYTLNTHSPFTSNNDEIGNSKFIPDIPSRSASEANSSASPYQSRDSKVSTAYSNQLAECVFDIKTTNVQRVLNFSETSPSKYSSPKTKSSTLGSPSKKLLDQVNDFELSPQASSKNTTPTIIDTPERVLDAPDLLDDYYLNLLDWSSKNILAVSLSNALYLWNVETKQVTELMRTESPDNYISSVQFSDDGSEIAIGTNYARVQIWDIQSSALKRTMRGHLSRVGSLSWKDSHILSSGSRDSTIVNHDIRIAQNRICTLQGHTQEVCGLKWSPDKTVLASGGNDNTLCLWDNIQPESISDPKFRLTDHIAAVKAISWCPWKPSLLASGGGTADRTIRFWNTSTGTCLSAVDTGSQVCALRWNRHTKQLISSHGFSLNQICTWKFPSMQKQCEFTGHQSRVLHLAMSPDETTIVSAAGDRDQTLRFWKLFEGSPKSLINPSVTYKKNSLTSRMNLR